MSTKNTLLKIEDLKVNINGNEILKGLNLEIKEGEIHALMGVNGAGKSTLVKTLAAHYDCEVTSGKVTFKKKDLLQMDVTTRANEGIFMSFQSPVEVAGVNNSYFLRTAMNAKRAYEGKDELDAMEFLKLVKEQHNCFSVTMKLYNNLYISENNQQNVAQFINYNTIIEKLSKDKNIEQKYRKKDGTLIKISIQPYS